jgi:hypothetical protein
MRTRVEFLYVYMQEDYCVWFVRPNFEPKVESVNSVKKHNFLLAMGMVVINSNIILSVVILLAHVCTCKYCTVRV